LLEAAPVLPKASVAVIVKLYVPAAKADAALILKDVPSLLLATAMKLLA